MIQMKIQVPLHHPGGPVEAALPWGQVHTVVLPPGARPGQFVYFPCQLPPLPALLQPSHPVGMPPPLMLPAPQLPPPPQQQPFRPTSPPTPPMSPLRRVPPSEYNVDDESALALLQQFSSAPGGLQAWTPESGLEVDLDMRSEAALRALSVADLKTRCRALGTPVTGNKAQLIERVLDPACHQKFRPAKKSEANPRYAGYGQIGDDTTGLDLPEFCQGCDRAFSPSLRFLDYFADSEGGDALCLKCHADLPPGGAVAGSCSIRVGDVA